MENQTNETTEATATTESQATGTVRPRNDFTSFITTWESSNSLQEVADKLGITPASAGQRASNYRREHGIDLKKMQRGGGAKLDVSAAKELLAKLRTKTQEAEAEADTQAPA